MFIKRLLIRNYRCFGNQVTVVEFSKSGLTALIGPNNVGKSTALRVLELLLGDKWPSSSQFDENDFHNNDLSKDIILACEFFKPISINIKDYSIDIIGAVIRVKHLPTGYGESSVDVEYKLLESDGGLDDLDYDSLDIATYRFSDGRRGDFPINVGREVRNQLPIVITVPLVKLHREQPTNKWSILGKMLQKVERNFVAGGRENEFKQQIRRAVSILRSPSEFNAIESDIKRFWDSMKPSNLGETDLEFLDFEPWRYYRQFKLAVTRGGGPAPLETLGEGVQRLAIIAIYRAYLKRHGRNVRAILLVEEPESYLHPQARKTLFNVLEKAVKEEEHTEGQIVYTTHSEDFVSCGRFDDIVLFSQSAGSVSTRRLSQGGVDGHAISLGQSADSLSDPHIHYRLVESVTKGLREALFAHRALIVEGPSDLELFRFFSDVDKDQIAVVVADGKSNIPSIYTFLTAFGIPCLVAIDKDVEGKPPEYNESLNDRIAKMLGQVGTANPDATRMEISKEEIGAVGDGEIHQKGRLLVFGKDLEAVLGRRLVDYGGLLSSVRRVFKLPSDSKPRDMQAIGMAYHGEDGGDGELRGRVGDDMSAFEELKTVLNSFTKQDLDRPSLLGPVEEVGGSEESEGNGGEEAEERGEIPS